MQKLFAIIENDKVVNIVVAEDKDSADNLYRDYYSVEITDLERKPEIGTKYIGENFIFPMPEVSEEEA
jgi:hypothetical protein